MLLWIWERKRATLQLDQFRILAMYYRTVSIFWIFPFAYSFHYELATYTQDGWVVQPVTKEQVAELEQSVEDSSVLHLNIWQRWGLFILIGVVMSIPVMMGIYFSVMY